MSGLYSAAFLAALAIYLLVSSARAKAGRASPKSPVLRAPGGEFRAEPVPPTWHCEHTWAKTQEISGPVVRRQAVVLIGLSGLCALSAQIGRAHV